MTAVSTESSLLEQIGQLLQARGLAFTRHPALPLLMLRFTMEDGQWGTFIDVQDRPRRFAIYSGYPRKVSAPARPALAEFLTRVNHGLYVGNFELDLDDGSVRFKTSLELADVALTAALFDQVLNVNLTETRRHLRAVAEVAEGRVSPSEALARLTAPPPPHGQS